MKKIILVILACGSVASSRAHNAPSVPQADTTPLQRAPDKTLRDPQPGDAVP
mgnify:CR=1 FL=1